MQLKVPEKFGICGFNDIEMAAYAEPALSTVRVNRYNMGSKAMEVIFEKITSPWREDRTNSKLYQYRF
jgi:LacI family gluconate utilization system Gnt-I transcriptional repressor